MALLYAIAFQDATLHLRRASISMRELGFGYPLERSNPMSSSYPMAGTSIAGKIREGSNEGTLTVKS